MSKNHLTSKKKTKVAIAEDQAPYLEGLAEMLEEYDDIKVCIKAANGKELIKKIKNIRPDVILMDLDMPEMNGFDATSYINSHYPEIKIIALTIHDEQIFVIDMIKRGAHGFMNKNTDIDEIKAAIDTVMDNDHYFDKSMRKKLVEGIRNKMKVSPGFKSRIQLTNLEREVLKLICKEFTTKEIAQKLDSKAKTIANYRNRLLDKTNSKNTAGLVIFALLNDLIKIDLTKHTCW